MRGTSFGPRTAASSAPHPAPPPRPGPLPFPAAVSRAECRLQQSSLGSVAGPRPPRHDPGRVLDAPRRWTAAVLSSGLDRSRTRRLDRHPAIGTRALPPRQRCSERGLRVVSFHVNPLRVGWPLWIASLPPRRAPPRAPNPLNGAASARAAVGDQLPDTSPRSVQVRCEPLRRNRHLERETLPRGPAQPGPRPSRRPGPPARRALPSRSGRPRQRLGRLEGRSRGGALSSAGPCSPATPRSQRWPVRASQCPRIATAEVVT